MDVIWGRPSRSNAQPVLDGVEVQVEVEVPSRIDSGSQPPYMPFVSLGNSTAQGLLSLGNFKSRCLAPTRGLGPFTTFEMRARDQAPTGSSVPLRGLARHADHGAFLGTSVRGHRCDHTSQYRWRDL